LSFSIASFPVSIPSLIGPVTSKRIETHAEVLAYSGMADISLAVLPWKIIRRNTMNYKERIGMLVCMSMGVL
jgi:hypothetical protein